MKRKEIEVVVAHFNEDLSWLESTRTNYMVYTKGNHISTIPCETVFLPNIGREGHTYLHHIVTNYHQLAEVTLFLQGRISDHISESFQELVDQASKLNENDILTSSSRDLKLFDAWDGKHCDLHQTSRPSNRIVLEAPHIPGHYFAKFLGSGRVPLSVGFNPAAIFGVPRKLILRHSRAFYQEIMETMFLGPMAHNDPETGHMMEAFWLAMWKPEDYICWTVEDISVEERNAKGELTRGRWSPGQHCIQKEGPKESRADSPMAGS